MDTLVSIGIVFLCVSIVLLKLTNFIKRFDNEHNTPGSISLAEIEKQFKAALQSLVVLADSKRYLIKTGGVTVDVLKDVLYGAKSYRQQFNSILSEGEEKTIDKLITSAESLAESAAKSSASVTVNHQVWDSMAIKAKQLLAELY